MIYFSKFKIFFIIFISLVAIFISICNLNPYLKKTIIPYNHIKLGLDLSGGSFFLLRIDFDYYIKERLSDLSKDIKDQLTKKRIKHRIAKKDNHISISFLEDNFNKKSTEVRKILKKYDLSKFDINDISDKKIVKIGFSNNEIFNIRKSVISESIEIVRMRLDENSSQEIQISSYAGDYIMIQIPNMNNPENIRKLLGSTAKMTFHLVKDNSNYLSKNLDSNLLDPLGFKYLNITDSYGRNLKVTRESQLNGAMLSSANATFYEGEPAVMFQFNSVGTVKFAKLTKENIGKRFAIIMDNKVITAPVINDVIPTGSGVISGNMSIDEANNIALMLRAGALPAPLYIEREKIIGASLGKDSVEIAKKSFMVASIIILIYLLLSYKIFGMIAFIAVIINLSLIISLLSFISAAISLTSIAAIILIIGMGIDSNILIFERIKEELKNNKSKQGNIIKYIDKAFKKSFTTIIDSNLTTIIVAIILYLAGTESIKSFAITLSFGILSSIFSSIFFSRMLIIFTIKKNIFPNIP